MTTSTGNVIATPSAADLANWEGLDSVEDFDAPIASVNFWLQAANDLLQLATGITKAPDPNTPLGRIAKFGIMDMAWFVGTSMEDRDEFFSPFSSERIGSYSYSKASANVRASLDTGVPFFDQAVKWLSGAVDADQHIGLAVTSENVFPRPQSRYRQQVEHLGPLGDVWLEDPSMNDRRW